MYGLLIKREVKMARYWPSFFFVHSWTEIYNKVQITVYKFKDGKQNGEGTEWKPLSL